MPRAPDCASVRSPQSEQSNITCRDVCLSRLFLVAGCGCCICFVVYLFLLLCCVSWGIETVGSRRKQEKPCIGLAEHEQALWRPVIVSLG